MSDTPPAADPPLPREPGPIEKSVAADVASLGEAVNRAGKRSLAAMAIKLARVLDTRGDEEPASQTAKAVDTLRILLGQLMQGDTHDPDAQRSVAEILGTPTAGGSSVSAPVRYPKVTRTSDVGARGGPDRDSTG